MRIKLIVILAAANILAGCVSTMLSDDKILKDTASVIGARQENLFMVSRKSESLNTYYTVKTRKGTRYICSITGGGLLTYGISDAPICTKQIAER